MDINGASLVPGLYRLLAHWSAYLGHVAVELLPLLERPDIVQTGHDIVRRIDDVMPIIIDGIVAAPPSTRKLRTKYAAFWASI